MSLVSAGKGLVLEQTCCVLDRIHARMDRRYNTILVQAALAADNGVQIPAL